MIELLIVTLISLVIGAGIGSCLSVPVSNKLLANEISNASSKYDNIGKNFGMGDFNPDKIPGGSSNDNSKVDFKNMNFNIANVSEVNSIDAVVDFNVLAKLLGIGVLLTLLSSLASMVAIARFSPLQILKERG